MFHSVNLPRRDVSGSERAVVSLSDNAAGQPLLDSVLAAALLVEPLKATTTQIRSQSFVVDGQTILGGSNGTKND